MRLILGATLVAAVLALPARARSQVYFPQQYLPPFAGVSCSGAASPTTPNIVPCDALTFFFGSHGGENAQVHRLLVKLNAPGWQFAQPMNFLSVQDSVTFRGGPPAVPFVISSTPNEFFISFLGRDPVMRAYPAFPIDVAVQVTMARFGPPTPFGDLPATFDWQFAEWDPNGVLIASNITPEPVSLVLFATGLAGVAALRRRRRKGAAEAGRD